MRGNSLKLQEERFRFDIRENFFTQRAVRLLKDVMESLEGFKRAVDMTLEDMV